MIINVSNNFSMVFQKVSLSINDIIISFMDIPFSKLTVSCTGELEKSYSSFLTDNIKPTSIITCTRRIKGDFAVFFLA